MIPAAIALTYAPQQDATPSGRYETDSEPGEKKRTTVRAYIGQCEHNGRIRFFFPRLPLRYRFPLNAPDSPRSILQAAPSSRSLRGETMWTERSGEYGTHPSMSKSCLRLPERSYTCRRFVTLPRLRKRTTAGNHKRHKLVSPPRHEVTAIGSHPPNLLWLKRPEDGLDADGFFGRRRRSVHAYMLSFLHHDQLVVADRGNDTMSIWEQRQCAK